MNKVTYIVDDSNQASYLVIEMSRTHRVIQ